MDDGELLSSHRPESCRSSSTSNPRRPTHITRESCTTDAYGNLTCQGAAPSSTWTMARSAPSPAHGGCELQAGKLIAKPGRGDRLVGNCPTLANLPRASTQGGVARFRNVGQELTLEYFSWADIQCLMRCDLCDAFDWRHLVGLGYRTRARLPHSGSVTALGLGYRTRARLPHSGSVTALGPGYRTRARLPHSGPVTAPSPRLPASGLGFTHSGSVTALGPGYRTRARLPHSGPVTALGPGYRTRARLPHSGVASAGRRPFLGPRDSPVKRASIIFLKFPKS